MISFLALVLAQAADPPPTEADLDAAREAQAQAENRAEALEREAEAQAARARDISQRLIAIADDIAQAEREANALEAQLSRLRVEEAALTQALSEDREALQRVLAALQRAEMRKPPPLAASPDDAASAARSALLLSAIAPRLRERAEIVLDQLQALESARDEIARQSAALAQTVAELTARREEAADLLTERQAARAALQDQAATARSRAAELAGEVESLAELLTRLEAEREAQRLAALRSFEEARGALRPPVEGVILSRFAQGAGGARDTGLTFQARSGAQVVSPFDATVEHAGPLEGYGELLILSVGEGYHLILAGMARLNVVYGQTLLAGEPVGAMPENALSAPELYYEVRRNGSPVDPEPWLRPDNPAG